MKSLTLEERHSAEQEFHDKKFSTEYKTSYYSLSFGSVMVDRLKQKLGNLHGKKVIDYGCGQGWLTKALASGGADVWAFDISEEAVKKTIEMANRFNLKNKVHVEQMPAEQLNFESNTFDLIVGNAILHHLDLEVAANEIKRVLVEGGKAYFMEPLGHNPALNLFRKLTPQLRSKDEMPLRFEQFSILRNIFSRFEHDEFFLFSTFALLLHFLYMDRWVLKSRDILLKLDNKLLSIIPSTRRYCWYSIIMMQK